MSATIRLSACRPRFLEAQQRAYPHAMPWSVLSRGFDFQGRRLPLLSQQGIFRPAVCRLPLTIRTAPVVEGRPRPYEDEVEQERFLAYRYRGTDRSHRDNEGLRVAMRERVPLVDLYGVAEGGTSPHGRSSSSGTIRGA